MRKNWIVGNWKLHGTRAEIEVFLSTIGGYLGSNSSQRRVEAMVALPFVYLSMAANAPIPLAAQNLSEYAEGAHTGEVSAAMLRDCGVKAVIIGHSERRAQHGETHKEIARKVLAAQAEELIPILCVGETLTERQAGAAEASCAKQLHVLKQLGGSKAFRSIILAYEPVWAIGAGQAAGIDVIETMHRFLRKEVEQLAPESADEVPLLYGGSVKPANADSIFSSTWIDGALVGNASLDATQFSMLYKQLDERKVD